MTAKSKLIDFIFGEKRRVILGIAEPAEYDIDGEKHVMHRVRRWDQRRSGRKQDVIIGYTYLQGPFKFEHPYMREFLVGLTPEEALANARQLNRILSESK